MHRIFVAALVAAVLIVPARAADVPVKGPVYKAAPAAYDWRGFYIGAHAGGIWVDGDFTAIPGGTGSATGSSFIGGALIGYNWRLAPTGSGVSKRTSASPAPTRQPSLPAPVSCRANCSGTLTCARAWVTR